MSDKRYELKVYSDFTVMEGLSTPFDYLDKALLLGLSGMAITDRMTAAGCCDWMAARDKMPANSTFQSIFGAELMVQNDLFPNDFHKTFCVSVLAKNADGLRLIYRILSACAKGGKDTAVSLEYLIGHRDDLLLGSCTEQGIFFHRTNQNHRPESFFEAAGIFDYLEVCPTMDQDIVTIITMLGEHHDIPVVAVSDARYCYRAQKPHYHALCSANALTDVTVHDKELCSASQLMRHFSYLGEASAKKIVYDNTEAVAKQVESFSLFSSVLQSIAPNSDAIAADIRNLLRERFGEQIPDFVAKRVNEELAYFAKHGLFGHLQTLYRISNLLGNAVAFGCYANSYLLYLLGVTCVDPLPTHCCCSECKTVECLPHHRYGDVIECPKCGKRLVAKGVNLPFDHFVRSKDKNLLSLICADSGLSLSREALLSLFSSDHVQQIGAFRTMTYTRFRRFYEQLSRDRDDCLPPLAPEQSFDKLSVIGGGVSTFSDGQVNYLVTPPGVNVYDVTALCRDTSSRKERLLTACSAEDLYHTGLTVVHFHASSMMKQLSRLEQKSKLKITEDTPYIAEAISFLETLDDDKLQLLPSGGLGYLIHLFDDIPPDSFAALSMLFSIGHSSKLWVNNFSDLIDRGMASVTDIFTDIESLDQILLQCGFSSEEAIKIAAAVSVGKGEQVVDEALARKFQMCGLPEWFAAVLQKIRRLHPKAYGVAEADIFCRLIWYAMHDPKLYRRICVKESE